MLLIHRWVGKHVAFITLRALCASVGVRPNATIESECQRHSHTLRCAFTWIDPSLRTRRSAAAWPICGEERNARD